MSKLSRNLKTYRKDVGFTQQQIADVLGIDRSTYTYYESGKILPDIKTVRKLTKILQVDYADLLDEESDPLVAEDDGQNVKEHEIVRNARVRMSSEEKQMVMIYRILGEGRKKELLEALKKEVKGK